MRRLVKHQIWTRGLEAHLEMLGLLPAPAGHVCARWHMVRSFPGDHSVFPVGASQIPVLNLNYLPVKFGEVEASWIKQGLGFFEGVPVISYWPVWSHFLFFPNIYEPCLYWLLYHLHSWIPYQHKPLQKPLFLYFKKEEVTHSKAVTYECLLWRGSFSFEGCNLLSRKQACVCHHCGKLHLLMKECFRSMLDLSRAMNEPNLTDFSVSPGIPNIKNV